MHFREAAETQAGQVAGQRRDRLENLVVVEDAVVDLVAQQQQAMPGRDRDDTLKQLARVVRAGRVVRVDQDDRARARRHQRFDLVRVGEEVVARIAAVIDRPAIVEDGRRRPQRVIRRRHQHFVARVEQGAQADVDQLTDAVADEHALRRRVGRAA